MFFFWHWIAPRSTLENKNTACLVTYLIATGHHLRVRFPLLVFRAQMRLISWLALIRGHISENSRVSHTACWEKWNAINQSSFLFNILDSGNKQNADRVSDAEMKEVWWTEKKEESSEVLQTCFGVKVLQGPLKSGVLCSLLQERWYKWVVFFFKLKLISQLVVNI